MLTNIYYMCTSWDARLCSGFGTIYGNIMVKKIIMIELEFWDNVQKYNSKKTLEIKLGF